MCRAPARLGHRAVVVFLPLLSGSVGVVEVKGQASVILQPLDERTAHRRSRRPEAAGSLLDRRFQKAQGRLGEHFRGASVPRIAVAGNPYAQLIAALVAAVQPNIETAATLRLGAWALAGGRQYPARQQRARRIKIQRGEHCRESRRHADGGHPSAQP